MMDAKLNKCRYPH